MFSERNMKINEFAHLYSLTQCMRYADLAGSKYFLIEMEHVHKVLSWNILVAEVLHDSWHAARLGGVDVGDLSMGFGAEDNSKMELL